MAARKSELIRLANLMRMKEVELANAQANVAIAVNMYAGVKDAFTDELNRGVRNAADHVMGAEAIGRFVRSRLEDLEA